MCPGQKGFAMESCLIWPHYAAPLSLPLPPCRIAVDYDNDSLRDELNKLCKVNGIPSLCVFNNETGKLVTDTGRAMVTAAKKLDGVFTG